MVKIAPASVDDQTALINSSVPQLRLRRAKPGASMTVSIGPSRLVVTHLYRTA
jgi:hypothetical protein